MCGADWQINSKARCYVSRCQMAVFFFWGGGGQSGEKPEVLATRTKERKGKPPEEKIYLWEGTSTTLAKAFFTKQNKTKQNKTKQNKTKQNKTKQNKTEQNRTEQNKTKQKIHPSIHRHIWELGSAGFSTKKLGTPCFESVS